MYPLEHGESQMCAGKPFQADTIERDVKASSAMDSSWVLTYTDCTAVTVSVSFMTFTPVHFLGESLLWDCGTKREFVMI